MVITVYTSVVVIVCMTCLVIKPMDTVSRDANRDILNHCATNV